MALIQVSVIEDVLTPEQKRRVVEKLTAAILEVTGEAMRLTWANTRQVPGGEAGHGGQAFAAADAHALAPTDRHANLPAPGESRVNRPMRLALGAAIVLVMSGCGVVKGTPTPGQNRGAVRSHWQSPDRGPDWAGRLAVDGRAAAFATAA